MSAKIYLLPLKKRHQNILYLNTQTHWIKRKSWKAHEKYIDPECIMAMNQNVYAKFATENAVYISCFVFQREW